MLVFQVVFHEKRNASHKISAPSIGPPFFFECGVVSPFTFFEQCLECTETAMASAVLTVEADGNEKFLQNFLVGLFLGFVPLRVERLCVVVLQFDLQRLIEVHDGFVCVADLERLIDRPCVRLAFPQESVCRFVQLLLECRLFFRSLRSCSS